MPDPRELWPIDFDELVRRTTFWRDLRNVIELAKNLDAALAVLIEHENRTAAHDLIKGGLPKSQLGHPLVEGFLDDVSDLTHDVRGFQWALAMFVSIAESGVQPDLHYELEQAAPNAALA